MTPASSRLEAHASSPTKRRLVMALGLLDRTSYYAVIVAMGLMTALVATQVFSRYVLSTSIDSADELSRLCFVWAIFLAIPHGIKTGIHVGIDALVSLMPSTLQAHLARLMALCSAALMATLFWLALGAVMDKWQELMPTINVTAAVFYIAVLICAGHSCLHLLAQAFTWEAPVEPSTTAEGGTAP